MRGHFHVDQLTGHTSRGLDGLEGDRVLFAGMDASFLTGGAGFASPIASQNANGAVVAGGGPQTHLSVIALVLIAVAILFTLDKAGFRFAVTAGRR